MSKTPYEIRLELLSMAKDIAYEKYHNQKEEVILNWENQTVQAQKAGLTLPPSPQLPTCPTEEQIVTTAKFLGEYIDSKPDKGKKSPELLCE